MNAAPLTAAQLSAMQENVAKWNARFPQSPDSAQKQEAERKLKESHFKNLPHYVLD